MSLTMAARGVHVAHGSFAANSMKRRAQSSGDMIADRRYAYALASLAEGEAAAAADLLEQSLERAPEWAAAWFSLGEAREALRDDAHAVDAYRRAMQLDRDGALGAELRLARLRALPAPAAAPPAHVAALFDQYAPRFETHLVETLNYHAPELLRDMFGRVCASRSGAFHFAHALDLGCGTGLVAKAMRYNVNAIDGVDISPAMIEQARSAGVYDRLAVGDVEAFLRDERDASADLVVAADVFVYIGDLANIFQQTARLLTPGGLFGFSLQSRPDGDYALGDDLRYAQSNAYVRRLAVQNALDIALIEAAPVRRDNGVDVPGSYVVLAKP